MSEPASKQKIAIDVDEVLAANAPSFVAYSNKKWGTNFKVEDYHEHWTELWQTDEKEMDRRVNEMFADGFVKDHKPIKEANEILKELSRQYELHVITSRRKIIEKDTKQWLDKFFPSVFTEIHFAGIWDKSVQNRMQMTKSDLLRSMNIKYFIDDQPRHCFAAAEAGIKTLLFGDYPWNKDIDKPKNVFWVKNWQEVGEYFKNEQSRLRI
jgi:5'(3')-deoxyribonucleotidase